MRQQGMDSSQVPAELREGFARLVAFSPLYVVTVVDLGVGRELKPRRLFLSSQGFTLKQTEVAASPTGGWN